VTKSTNQLHYLIRVQIILKGGNKYMYAIPYGKPYLKQLFLKEYKQIRIFNSRYYFRWLIFFVCWVITLNSRLVVTCHRLFLLYALWFYFCSPIFIHENLHPSNSSTISVCLKTKNELFLSWMMILLLQCQVFGV
jgi:hypothetical protein